MEDRALQNLERASNDRVVKIVDPLTIELQEKGLTRLTALDIPDYNPYEQGPLAQSAMEILGDMLIGKEVRIYQTRDRNKGRKNRMGHNLYHLFLNDSESWVQGVLVRLGLARVRTDPSNAELARELFKLESLARREKLGLWAFEENSILNPDNAQDHINSFQIVEGRVESAARKQSNLYLNFGKNWRDDFTVAIPSSDIRQFLKKDISPQNLNGQTIRVRGWIREYNGAYMELNHPERIEILQE
ncbi:MAG: thermonuclease family protein [Alphaproteobacteria bacterium]